MNGAPDGLREVHDLVDLLGEDLAERPAEHREVLREHEDLASVDRAPTGDHTVGERTGVLDAEAVGPVAGEHVELDERVRVAEQLEPLPHRQLPPLVLALHRRRAARVERLLPQLGQVRESLLDRVGHRSDGWIRSGTLALDVLFFDGHSNQVRSRASPAPVPGANAQRLGANSITRPPNPVTSTPLSTTSQTFSPVPSPRSVVVSQSCCCRT